MILVLEILFWVSVALILYTYIGYPLMLKIFDLAVPRPKFKQTSDTPAISILIAAYNEEKVIKSRIENCRALDYPQDKIEIIIGSDCSDDRTNAIVRQYENQGVRLVAFEERRGKVNILNDLVKLASHDILVFTDANTMFKRDAVKNLVRHFGDERIGCVVGGLQFVNPTGGLSGDLEGFYWRYETTLKKLAGRRGYVLGANGAIFALRKGLYEPCPSNTIIEDFVIAMRVLQKGFLVIYDPLATALEEATHKIIQEKKRRVRIGMGDYQSLSMLWPLLNPAKGFVAYVFWSHKVIRWLVPFLMIIALISNLALMDYPVYGTMLLLQAFFYGCALLGQILSRTTMRVKPLSMCYYFVSMNYALLIGFFKFLQGVRTAAWERTER